MSPTPESNRDENQAILSPPPESNRHENQTTSTPPKPNHEQKESNVKLLLRARTIPSSKPDHASNEENDIDPDEGNSRLCSVCFLPIFSTPFVESNDGNKTIFMHEQCASLPREFEDSVLHPGQPLILGENRPPKVNNNCDNCGEKIRGTKYYACGDHSCNRKYDVVCALTSIKILHKSHEHRLMAIRGGVRLSRLLCGACGASPQDHRALKTTDVSYLCGVCGFWLHPHCALLPNAIVLQHDDSNSSKHHEHPLVLNYHLLSQVSETERKCAICERVIESVGCYSCTGTRTWCRNYCVHIMCAISDPHIISIKKVSILDARLPDLLRLPVLDEHTSVVRHIADSTTSIIAGLTSSGSEDHQHLHDKLLQQHLHEHQLTLHKDDDDDDRDRVCNACVQFISPPYYKCSECLDFILHDCCAHLPPTLTQLPTHKQHSLSLTKDRYFMCINPYTNCCYYATNGFFYSCEDCFYEMDVLCALMPTSITHEAHSKAHVLYSSFTESDKVCDCCGQPQEWRVLFYKCGTCRNFGLHSRCALLPNKVTHRFDEHPLKLIAKTPTSKQSESSTSSHTDDHDASDSRQQKVMPLCEICEKDINDRWWYYSCEKCNRSFHINCIPCLDGLNKIKLGRSIRVGRHTSCPLTLIRGLTLVGSHCGYCGQTFKDCDSGQRFSHYEGLAWECSKCDFRIHFECAG